MYSPADLPSSSRAAPAKKRIWSHIGGDPPPPPSRLRLPPFFGPTSHSPAAPALLLRRGLLRLARVLRLDVDELVGAGLDRVGDPQQRALALARRGVAPALERARGGPEGRVDIGLARQCGVREHVAGARVDQLGR